MSKILLKIKTFFKIFFIKKNNIEVDDITIDCGKYE